MLNKFLLSEYEQDTSHIQFMWNGILPYNPTLVSSPTVQEFCGKTDATLDKLQQKVCRLFYTQKHVLCSIPYQGISMVAIFSKWPPDTMKSAPLGLNIPVVWVVHFLQEFLQFISLWGSHNFLAGNVIANVRVVVIPLHWYVTHCITDVLKKNNLKK